MPRTDDEIENLLTSIREETRAEFAAEANAKELEFLRGIYDLGFNDGFDLARAGGTVEAEEITS